MTASDKASEDTRLLSNELRKELLFWYWLPREGLPRLFDGWLAVHVLVGFLLSALVAEDLREVAKTIFQPFASILIGLAFAWGGNAMAILQTRDAQLLGGHADGGFRGYVFTYQLAVLVILATLIIWTLLGLGIVERWPGMYANDTARLAGRTAAFALVSLAVRECWSVVLGSQTLLLIRDRIQRESAGKK